LVNSSLMSTGWFCNVASYSFTDGTPHSRSASWCPGSAINNIMQNSSS
jgi:hypothetical protein